MRSLHERTRSLRIKRISPQRATLEDYVIGAISWALFAAAVLGAISAVHHFVHAKRRIEDEIVSSRAYVSAFCSNDTLVRITKRFQDCEVARRIAARDPAWEAAFEVAEALRLCSSAAAAHPHDEDEPDHRHASSTHCSHVNYVIFGAVFGGISVICALRYCLRTSSRSKRHQQYP